MTTSVPVSVMIFTLNEQIHLPACLDALSWCDDVIVVDSFSTDATQTICESRGARFFQNKFDGFGHQRNWALDNTSPKYQWILILDADERVTPALVQEMARVAETDTENTGAYQLRRRFYMWGRWLRHSSLYPTWVVRFIRLGRVRYVNRGHAETQEVQGDIGNLENDLIDENLKGIDEWFDRQNRYASKEAEFELEREKDGLKISEVFSSDALVGRAAVKRLAGKMPARGLIYFLYSYVFRLGLLDGKPGFVFCMMKAWYQSQIAMKKYDSRMGGKKPDVS
ncbi:MAG: glycosyltransferase family 2 protein [Arenimonas sp.]